MVPRIRPLFILYLGALLGALVSDGKRWESIIVSIYMLIIAVNFGKWIGQRIRSTTFQGDAIDCAALVGILWIVFVSWSHSANGATLNKLVPTGTAAIVTGLLAGFVTASVPLLVALLMTVLRRRSGST